MPKKGYKQTEYHKSKYNREGKNNSFYGKHHTNKTKKKIGISSKNRINGKKGKKLSEETKRKIKENHANIFGKNHPLFGTHRSKKTKEKIRQKSKGINRNVGKNNPMFGKKGILSPRYNKPHTKETKKKMKKTIRKHHIYLKENSDKIMKLSVRKHCQLHLRAYEYIYCNFGKKGINNYLKWFDRKYGLRKDK